MLLRFNVSNFMSISEEQELSMYCGNVGGFEERIVSTDDINVLKFCALYGANASGKSNFIKAIDFAKNIVIKGVANLNCEDKCCKIENNNSDFISKFEFEIKIKDSIFAYGFLVDLYSSKIEGEWLYNISKIKEDMIFERNLVLKTFKHNIRFSNEGNKNRFDIYAEDSLNMNKDLLVSDINRKNICDSDFNIFKEIYNWFYSQLVIIYPNTGSSSFSVSYCNDNAKIVKLLNYFDTGITGFTMKEVSIDELSRYVKKSEIIKLIKVLKNDNEMNKNEGIIISNNNLFRFKYNSNSFKVSKVLFKHGDKCSKLFEFADESDGTKRLIDLLEVISNYNNDKVFIIDELDRNFHPVMTKKFVDTFFKATENTNTQLIISTHEASIMDLDFLRKDEIWFAERANDFTTKIYSLDEFKIRDKNVIYKDYLEGRYGAIPLFKKYDSYIGEYNEGN